MEREYRKPGSKMIGTIAMKERIQIPPEDFKVAFKCWGVVQGPTILNFCCFSLFNSLLSVLLLIFRTLIYKVTTIIN